MKVSAIVSDLVLLPSGYAPAQSASRSALLTDSACSFPRLIRDDDAPGLSLSFLRRQLPRFARRTMLRIVLVAVDATEADARGLTRTTHRDPGSGLLAYVVIPGLLVVEGRRPETREAIGLR